MAKKPKQIKDNDIQDLPKGSSDSIKFDNEDELVQRIIADFDHDRAEKWQWVLEREKDIKGYFGIKKKSEWPFKGAAKISSGFHRICVDTLVANTIKSINAPEKRIQAAPLNSKSLENAKYVEDLANLQADYEYDLTSVLDRALPNACVESFTVLAPEYSYDDVDTEFDVTRMVPAEFKQADLSFDPDTDTVIGPDGNPVPSYDPADLETKEYDSADLDHLHEVSFHIEKSKCLHDGVKINVIGGSRFYMPVMAPGETPFEKVQRASHVIHETFWTAQELEDTDAFDEKATAAIVEDTYDRVTEILKQEKFQEAGLNVSELTAKEVISVLKWCGKWEIGGKKREVFVWLEKKSGKILRREVNRIGIRPYFPVVPFPVDDTPYGESMPKIIRNLVATLDLLLSTIANIGLMKSAPVKFFDPSSGFDPSTMGAIGPNSWIPAREPSRNVYIPPMPEDPQVLMSMVQTLINLIERITSVNEVVQGQVSDRANTTATEVQQSLVRSGVRFDLIYMRIKSQLSPMFAYIHELTKLHMPLKKEISYMGQERIKANGPLFKISQGQAKGEFNFALSGNSIVTEQGELNKAVTLFNTLGQHPYISYKPQSVYYMLYNIVKHLNPLAMDQILATPEEVMKIERDQQQVQREQEQQASQQAQAQMQSQGQAEQQAQQMQIVGKQQELKMAAEKHQQDMQAKELSFQQDLKHKEDKHKVELELMREKAKAKEDLKPKSDSK